MERLTEFHNGIWGMSVQAVKDGYDRYSVFSKLAEYEDTKIEPYQIELIQEDKKLLSRENKEYREEIFRLREELKGYRDAEEQGLLIKPIPYKIGNMVYWISGFSKNINVGMISSIIVSSFGVDLSIFIKETGRTIKREVERVFLTREAAEQALKGSEVK